MNRQLKELVNDSFLPLKLREDYYEEEGVGFFSPLHFFEILTPDLDITLGWEELGLYRFIFRKFRWGHKLRLFNKHIDEEITISPEKIYLFEGRMLDINIYHVILKIFMQGGKVILNLSGLSQEISRKMEIFFLENKLEIQKVNLLTKVSNVELGEGRLISFEENKIKDATEERKVIFWRKLFTTFDLLHLDIPHVDGIDYFWKTRFATSNELNYEEVRRLSLYNRTSYKKKVKFNIMKNFALMRIVDKTNAYIRSSAQDIEVELLPNGVVALDFGIFF